MAKKKSAFKKGQFYAAKHKGNNGDLIVGEVKSVRKNGDVILTNLLTGNRSVKGADILRKRNKRISKSQADELLAIYEQTDDKQHVREMAVDLPAYDEAQQEISFEPPKEPDPAESYDEHYDINIHVFIRRTGDRTPTKHAVEDTITRLLLAMPRLNEGAAWDVSAVLIPGGKA